MSPVTTTRTAAPTTYPATILTDDLHGRRAHYFTPRGLRLTGTLHTTDGLPRLINGYGTYLIPTDTTVHVHVQEV